MARAVYTGLKILLKRIFDADFRRARNEFLSSRKCDYRQIEGLYKEGLVERARLLEKELEEKESSFGVIHDYNLYGNAGIFKLNLKTLKAEAIH